VRRVRVPPLQPIFYVTGSGQLAGCSHCRFSSYGTRFGFVYEFLQDLNSPADPQHRLPDISLFFLQFAETGLPAFKLFFQ
jgi:hypothetical protein